MDDDVLATSRRHQAVRCLVAVRRTLREAATPALFLDPALDMMLALYLAGSDGDPVPLDGLCTAAGVSERAGRHWQQALVQGHLASTSGGVTRLTDRGIQLIERINDVVGDLAPRRDDRVPLAG